MNLAKIKGFKIVTTIMDSIVAVIAGLGAIFCFIIFEFLSHGVDWIYDALNNVDADSLTAGYEVIAEAFGFVGGLLLEGVALAGLFLCLMAAVIVLIPSVFSIVLLVRSKKLLQESPKRYKHGVIIDSIIKLVANGVPVVCLVYEIIASKTILGFDIIAILYLSLICLFEILILLWNRSTD